MAALTEIKAKLADYCDLKKMSQLIIIFATLAVVAFTAPAHASALIANCTMKSNADVKTLPTTGDEHLSWKVPKELDVYDQYGTQWAYITSDDEEYRALGTALVLV